MPKVILLPTLCLGPSIGETFMRFLLPLLVCLLVSIPQVGSGHYVPGLGEAFVLVRVDGERGPELQSAGLFLVAEVPDGYLAFVDSHELGALRTEGVSVEVLEGRDTHEFEYLIAYDHPHGHPLAVPDPGADVLFEGDGYRVLRVPTDIVDMPPSCVPEIQRVYRRPLSFVRRPWTEPSLYERGVTADPDVLAALANIVQADLQSQVQVLQDFGTRHSDYNGGLLASQWIRDQFLSYGYTDVSFHDYNSWNDNVVCVKPGSIFPDEVVVIGAHYDSVTGTPSIAPGADDNASGTVGVLEAARALAGIDCERTIVFICFSGEDRGLSVVTPGPRMRQPPVWTSSG